jgi:hypothetical protein
MVQREGARKNTAMNMKQGTEEIKKMYMDVMWWKAFQHGKECKSKCKITFRLLI